MPTPTPRQAMTFTYASYTASKLGLTFECGGLSGGRKPAGYLHPDGAAEQQKDNHTTQFILQLSNVQKNYTANNMKQDVRNYTTDLGKVNYKDWRLYDTAERTLMGKNGYYVNYRGVMHDGTVVRGRVHMALLDNDKLLMLHFSCPANYNSDYTKVYSHIRDTLKTL